MCECIYTLEPWITNHSVHRPPPPERGRIFFCRSLYLFNNYIFSINKIIDIIVLDANAFSKHTFFAKEKIKLHYFADDKAICMLEA